jgi:FAD/FMN-containing dehydrogenase
VVDDPDVLAGAVVDWTGRYHGSGACLLRPDSVDQVSAVLAWCSHRGVAVVPQGGNTGLVGGSVPFDESVVLSTVALSTLASINEAEGQVTAAAGVTLARVQHAAIGTGWEMPVDLAARDTCTVGGMVATNAGGMRVLRHGMMRANVLGLEAVLADGSVVSHLQGLAKDNTGYDLTSLLVGSEGTLAVVTAARLRLVPACAARVVALVACADMDDAVALATDFRRGAPSLDALEFMEAQGVGLVTDGRGISGLPISPIVVLVELAGDDDPDLVRQLSAVGDRAAVVANDSRSGAELWRVRDEHTTAIGRLGIAHKLDVTLPASELARFCRDVPEAIARVNPKATTYLFGHLGDGNVHVNVIGGSDTDADADAGASTSPGVDETVLTMVAQRGGSISAEHGIGRLKQRWLHLARSEAERAAFAAIKRALDPAGVLNPGVLIPDQPH